MRRSRFEGFAFLRRQAGCTLSEGAESQVTACLAPESGKNEIVVWDESVVGFVGPEEQHVLFEEDV